MLLRTQNGDVILVIYPLATSDGLGDRLIVVRLPAEARDYFALLRSVQTGSGDHPALYSMDNGGSLPGVKRSGSEADHSPPSSAEMKNVWSYTSILNISLHGVHRDNFTVFISFRPTKIPVPPKCDVERRF
jgi:hypothetical protein